MKFATPKSPTTKLRPTSLQALRLAERIYLRRIADAADLPPERSDPLATAWLIYAAFTRAGALLVKAPDGLPLAFPTREAAIAAIRDVRPDIEPDVRTDLSFLRRSGRPLPVSSAPPAWRLPPWRLGGAGSAVDPAR